MWLRAHDSYANLIFVRVQRLILYLCGCVCVAAHMCGRAGRLKESKAKRTSAHVRLHVRACTCEQVKRRVRAAEESKASMDEVHAQQLLHRENRRQEREQQRQRVREEFADRAWLFAQVSLFLCTGWLLLCNRSLLRCNRSLLRCNRSRLLCNRSLLTWRRVLNC